MSQDQLAGNFSSMSLDQNVGAAAAPQHTGKKNRRPHRAYHDLNAGTPVMGSTSSFTTPQLNSSEGFNNSNANIGITQTPQAFTPRQFDTQNFAGASPYNGASMGSPAIGGGASVVGVGNPQFNSPYEAGNNYAQSYEQQPSAATSHIISTQRWEDQLQYLTKSFETAKNSIPALPSTEFYCVDQGSCDPRLMNLSMYNIPTEEHLRSATKLPLGLTVQPFAPTLSQEEIPVISTNNEMVLDDGPQDVKEPLRCKRCRTYINPGFKFGYDSSAICNICHVKMKIPVDDFNSIDPNGQRPNELNKLELAKGAVDFLVPKYYNAIQGAASLPLHYVFVIDVSTLANENGSSIAMIEAVRNSIEYIKDNQENCKIALLAYDNKLRFYNLRSDLESAQEYIVTEINDVFLPLYNGLFVKPADSMKIINDTLKKIVDFIVGDKFSHVPQNCYGSALQAAKIALDTVTGGQGGKIVCSLNTLPTIGMGNLTLKKDDSIKKHVKCDNEFYNQLAGNLMRSYISVDLYVTSGAFVDMATIACPAEVTNGIVKYYPTFRRDHDEFMIINDMVDNISKIEGYQALLKVRSSSGMSVASYYLESVEYGDRDPMIPVVTRDTTMDVLLKYDEKLKAGSDVHFQTALLYTDLNGIRKVRSINCNGAVSNNIVEIFKFVNQNSVMRIMLQDIIRTLGNCDFASIRKIIDDKLVDILTQYRALVSGSSSTQLVLPDALKTLPMYLLSFEKGPLMRPNNHSTRGNERIYDLLKYKMFNPSKLIFKMYPQIIPFHVLLEESDLTFYDANERMLQVNAETINNISVRNGHNHLANGGCYFIFNGETVYLWFNENTNQMLLQDLLGVDPSLPIQSITLFSSSLPETGTNINEKASNVIKYWGQITGQNSIPVLLLRPNVDQYYSAAMSELLCEDKTVNMVESYDNYLVALHRKIQDKISKEDYTKIASGGKNHEQFHQKFVQF